MKRRIKRKEETEKLKKKKPLNVKNKLKKAPKKPRRKERSQKIMNHLLKVLIRMIIRSKAQMKVLIVPKIEMLNACIMICIVLNKMFMERNRSDVNLITEWLM
ncbi:unnamed protein product, partial [Brenthis ino]